MFKLLVTGGAGFIGSHVAEYFSNKGYEITVLDNLKRGEILGRNISFEHNIEFLRGLNNVSFVNGDVRDYPLLKELCSDVDVIVHTAAQVAVTTSLKNPREDFEINTLGTFNVLEAARLSKNNPIVIYCSTNKVYGDNVNRIPVVEKDTRYEFADKKFKKGIPEDFPIDLCEHTPYGCSKLAGDLYVQDYGHTYGLKTGVFRMSCIYGERQFGVEDQGWVAWFTIATMLDKPITIYGNGKQVRDVLYVKDLIELFDKFISSSVRNGVYNAGGGSDNTISLLELLNVLERRTGKKPKISFKDWRMGDQKVYISDISRAKRDLGWKPRIGLNSSLDILIGWINTNRQVFEL
jgi:CDP-paratose 2-epimerase